MPRPGPRLADLVLVDGPHEGVATITLNRPEKRNALFIRRARVVTGKTLDL
jgi:1,4-dihydroxy-2-naphthoyl-CoA synthase